MRDIPFFTTQNGVASLTLKEIPYRGEAYIRIQDAINPQSLLEECVEFCRCAGANRIYATGDACLERYPLHTEIWNMVRSREGLGCTDAVMVPITLETSSQFCELLNSRMQGIANASYMSGSDVQTIISKGCGYFVFRGETLLGIGVASSDRLDALVAAFSGAGKDVLLALNGKLVGDTINVEVASQNQRAVRFYERLGFLKNLVISKWYQII